MRRLLVIGLNSIYLPNIFHGRGAIFNCQQPSSDFVGAKKKIKVTFGMQNDYSIL